jgi:alpha/beta superfamily hydrolase
MTSMVAPSAGFRHAEDSMSDRPIFLLGPAGRLEARLRGDAIAAPRAVALLLHPHPLYGGSLHNKTLFRLAKSLAEIGVPSLRLNFRGVGLSAGSYHGTAESEDALCALQWLEQRHPSASLVAVGYSFGAAVGLAGPCSHPRLAAAVGLALPIALGFDWSWLSKRTLPLHFVQGERDEYGSCTQLRAFLLPYARAAHVECIAGADHLFSGCEDAAVAAVLRYIARAFALTRTGS